MIKLILEIADQNLALFGIVFFAIISLAMEIGYQAGVFMKNKGFVSKRSGMSGGFVISGMLALLAFFLGTVLSISSNEYQDRQAVVLAEANAIGSAWLIAGAQADDTGAGIQRLLQTYTKVRISAATNARTPEDELQIVKRTGELQNEIWDIASDIAKRSGDRVSALLLSALTEAFDNSVSQRAAFGKQIPTHMSRLLLITALLAILAAGVYFGTLRDRMLLMSTLLLLMFTGAIVLVADISLPYQGYIKVSSDPLVWTLDSIQPAP
jgi:hypothetical protein